ARFRPMHAGPRDRLPGPADLHRRRRAPSPAGRAGARSRLARLQGGQRHLRRPGRLAQARGRQGRRRRPDGRGQAVHRRALLTGGALATVGLLGTGGWLALAGGPSAGAADGSTATTLPPTTKTAKVAKRDLVQTEQVDGRLGYGSTRTIGGGPDGVITA